VLARADDNNLSELVARVAQLGRECPWTAEQTPQTVLSYMKEECSEVEAALNTAASEELTSELGDVLFNALLLIEVCARDGGVSVDAAAAASVSKLRRRYPPLFDGSLDGMSAAQANEAWSTGKAAEEAAATATQVDLDDDYDAALAAEIAELDRLEAEEQALADREQLARLVMEEIASEQRACE
tara:strand:- start:316 stop:870 length:555 start_codon:yes stop_codon:yes gene_type:complete